MTIGKKFTVIFHEDDSGVPVIDQLDFTGEFSYMAPYTSNAVVKKDDKSMTDNDRFIVTYFWASGDEPDLTTETIANLLSDAVDKVNVVLPGEAGN